MAGLDKIGFSHGRFNIEIVVSTWEPMEWTWETRHQCLTLTIDFDKACDQVEVLNPEYVVLLGFSFSVCGHG